MIADPDQSLTWNKLPFLLKINIKFKNGRINCFEIDCLIINFCSFLRLQKSICNFCFQNRLSALRSQQIFKMEDFQIIHFARNFTLMTKLNFIFWKYNHKSWIMIDKNFEKNPPIISVRFLFIQKIYISIYHHYHICP